MQIQAVCLPAIQLIPYYRGIQAKRMGRMDTQLMCAPGFRYERNKSTPRIIMQHSIISHGRFSVNRIDHLPRPVFRIRAEGEFNMTFFFLHNAIQPSNISFTHRPVLELCLQVLVHFFRLGYKDQAGGRHVKSVHDHRSGCFGIHPSHSPVDGIDIRFSGD